MRAWSSVVALLLAVQVSAWTTPPPSKQTSPRVPTTEPAITMDWQAAACKTFCGIALALGLVFGNPTIPEHVDTIASAREVVTTSPSAKVKLRECQVKDGNSILRLNLPTSASSLGDAGRQVQEAVELVQQRLELEGRTPVWNAAYKEVTRAQSVIQSERFLANIGEDNLPQTQEDVNKLALKLDALKESIHRKYVRSSRILQQDCSSLVYNIRLLSMGDFPYEIPADYKHLPYLKGRATVECTLERSTGRPFVLRDGSRSKQLTLTMTVDGYHAPITAGNFLDLVERKFYNGLTIQQCNDYTIQTGKPPTTEESVIDGFVDPTTKEKRVIPLELFYDKDTAPTYGVASEDDGIMANPFAQGALGMVHDDDNVNTASSQFYFSKCPSQQGLNGKYACFGYVTANQELLPQIREGDKITSMKVMDGGENLVRNRVSLMSISGGEAISSKNET